MGISDRREALRREIEAAEIEAAEIEREAAAEKALAKLDQLPDFEELADGSVVGLVVTYGPSRGYPVIAYKAGGTWHLTGKNSPNKIDSDGLADWLVTGGRRLRMAAVLAEFGVETVPAFDLGAALAATLGATPGERSAGIYRPGYGE